MRVKQKTFVELEADLRLIEAKIRRAQMRADNVRNELIILNTQREALEKAISQLLPRADIFINNYSKFKLVEAVLDVIQTSDKPLSPAEILGYMKSGGFQSGAKSPYTNVYMTCLRLVKNGSIAEITKEGKRMFVKK